MTMMTMTETCYKIIYRTPLGRMVSPYAPGCWGLSYFLGIETIPPEGMIFVYPTLKAAQMHCPDNSNCFILECRCPNLKVLQAIPTSPDSYRAFWCGDTSEATFKVKEYVTSSVLPIRRVKKLRSA